MYDGEPGDSLDMDMHGNFPSLVKMYDRVGIEFTVKKERLGSKDRFHIRQNSHINKNDGSIRSIL